MTERELIADDAIFAVDKDGREFEIRLMIGKPYPKDSPYGAWACPVAMSGLREVFPDLSEKFRDISGVDSWQALVLAMRLPKVMLEEFVESGGRLYFEKGGDEYGVDELFAKG